MQWCRNWYRYVYKVIPVVKKSDAVVENHVCISFGKFEHIKVFSILVLSRGVPVVKKSDAVVKNSVYISNVKFGL